MKCPNCNEEILPGSAFCGNCGASLANVEEAGQSNSIHKADTVVNMPSLFRLVVLSGSDKDKIILLDKNEVAIGRETDNVFVLLDPLISRHHALLRRKDDTYEVEDLDSANGVYLNGVRISGPQTLHDGDMMKLGNTEILFTRGAPDLTDTKTSETTIAMHDETPVKPRPVPSLVQQAAAPPPPPPAGSAPIQPPANGSTALHPGPAASTAQRREKSATNLVLLSCAIIVVLALILAVLIVIAMPQFTPGRRP